MLSIYDMPANARVWVYQSNRKLTNVEVAQIIQAGKKFIVDWAAHGSALKASFDVLHNLFIVLAVDEAQAQASGCSVDTSVKFLKELDKKYDLDLFNRFNVAYRYNKTSPIEVCSYTDFENMAAQELLNTDTIVYNNTITTKHQFDTNWEIPIEQSWHARVLN